MRQYNTYAKIMGEIYMVIQTAERDVENLKDLYDKLENSYCIHTYYFETQIRKVEEENAKFFEKERIKKEKEERERIVREKEEADRLKIKKES